MSDKKELPDAGAEKARQAGVSSAVRYEEVLMKEAYEHLGKGNIEQAANIFNDILRRFGVSLDDNQKSLLNSELGTFYFWLGDYESAKKHCEDALAYGDNDHAYSILGKIAVAEFKFPQARGYFSKISADNPAKALGMCLVSIKLRDTIGAQSFLQQAASKLPSSDPEFCVYRAYVNLLKGDTKLAISEIRPMVQKCDRDPFLLLLIAEIFMTAGNYGEATSVAEKVRSRAPEHDQVFSILAHASYAEEKFPDASAYAEKAVELNPRNAYAKTVLMKLAVRRGSYSLAESIGTEILKDCPEYSLGHANLGDVYFIQGSYEMAQIEYEHTMQLMNSDTKGAHLRQARIKFIDGRFAEAAEILEKLTEFYHTYYDDAMCDLLLCYDKLGNAAKKDEIMDKMEMRRSFYRRIENLLKKFGG